MTKVKSMIFDWVNHSSREMPVAGNILVDIREKYGDDLEKVPANWLDWSQVEYYRVFANDSRN